MSAPHLLRLLLLLICCYNILVMFVEGSDNKEKTGLVLEMIHRHSPSLMTQSNFVGPPKSRIDRTRQLVESDNTRRQMLSSHLKRMRMNQLTAWIPMHSGSDFGQGQYFVSLRVGSPHPQKIVLVTDTGSDLTWLNCQYACKDCPKSNHHLAGRIFRASNSSSFKTIPCSSDFCKFELVDFFSLNKCPSPHTPCLFDYRYLSGQQAIGVFANETLTVGLHHNRHKVRMHDVLIGCTKVYNESEGFPDGVMGLGYRKHSLALRLAEKFGNKFSYCLVNHLSSSNLKNYLSFGDVSLVEKPKMEYTELLVGYISSFYAVNVSGISVGNKMLNIPSEIWDVKSEGGMILDSGTSLTLLAGAAYDEVVGAFMPTLSKFEKIDQDTFKLPEFEFCFGVKGYNNSLVPNFVIHFGDGAKFEAPTSSYIIDVADGVKCLGIVRLDWPGTSVLGNIMQQNHFWEFDIGHGKLGFSPSSCVLSADNSKSTH